MKKELSNAGGIYVNMRCKAYLSLAPTIDMLNEIKRRTDTKKLICVIETDEEKEVIKYERSKEAVI